MSLYSTQSRSPRFRKLGKKLLVESGFYLYAMDDCYHGKQCMKVQEGDRNHIKSYHKFTILEQCKSTSPKCQ